MYPEKFIWGVASSAFQIEGHDSTDGCGLTIWDEYLDKGMVNKGQNAKVACDHIHRYPEDFKLMRIMGVKHYRFSLSWARLLPEGTGKVNEEGLRFYKDMIREMKANGITPYITLFHWEFPLALEKKGGWLNPECVQWFTEYAKLVVENFKEDCQYFITFNEPQCFIGLGYFRAFHAPGLSLPTRDVLQMIHHVLMAHGSAVKAMREIAGDSIKIGIAPTCGVALPASDSPADIEAAKARYLGMNPQKDNWTWTVTWFMDPVIFGRYPEEGEAYFGEDMISYTEEEMQLIAQPLDFMGQNVYNGYLIESDGQGGYRDVERYDGFPRTACGWPQTPECLYWGTKFLYERYKTPLFITENGMSCHDIVDSDGRVHDPDRIQFLEKYLYELQRSIDEGTQVLGYFLWTFLDNFEWDRGYNERFGLVYVDYRTQKRIVKDSAYWYKKTMETNGRLLLGNRPKKEVLHIEPVFKEIVWGGKRLAEEFGYTQVEGKEHVGECWAISAHENGDCTIRGGAYHGKKLSELYREMPALFGNPKEDKYPLLVKIIDATDKLSIQVHPDDAYASEHENGSFGKTECWYVLDCPENAELVIGHNASTREELEQMVAAGEYTKLIRRVPVKKGDFIQIEPGTIHAITEGLLILETQQSSDITYRVYDYDRQPPRPLHVKESLAVTSVPGIPGQPLLHAAGIPTNVLYTLADCAYYTVWKLDVTRNFTMEQRYPFLQVSVLSGDGVICGEMVTKGDHLIIPADYGKVDMTGQMELIISTPNEG